MSPIGARPTRLRLDPATCEGLRQQDCRMVHSLGRVFECGVGFVAGNARQKLGRALQSLFRRREEWDLQIQPRAVVLAVYPFT
jgi:hypothetical protein